jgi:hypothetical protein
MHGLLLLHETKIHIHTKQDNVHLCIFNGRNINTKLNQSTGSRILMNDYSVDMCLSFQFHTITTFNDVTSYPKLRCWLRAGQLRGRSSSSGRIKNFLFPMSSRPTLGSIQPPTQWVPGLFPRGQSGRGVKLTTHLQLVPKSRKCGPIHPLPHMPSWRSA